MLRQQEVQPDNRPNLSLADYIAPKGSGVPDYLGMFAVTGGIGAEELAKRLSAKHPTKVKVTHRDVAKI